jgi:hypothetical protein
MVLKRFGADGGSKTGSKSQIHRFEGRFQGINMAATL